ncbi:MAG: hypothetical protein CBC35_01580 [Planctomycetes bacterium TMED75]|nr:hypothetical protein [Planctomycetaceae bacterium]OUU96250.1 MAG: hypothetical protein CBC35_01580 [Planctomycetes bacterium TMED75]
MKALDILALEPWYAGSHRSVADSLTAHSAHRWTWRTRPGGGVRWCLRQSALTFAEEVGDLVKGGERWDAVFVSSLCSLSDFRACAPRAVRALPHVLYMHENQAAYPVSDNIDGLTRDRDAHLAFTNLASIEAADVVLFNSEHNRVSFIEAMKDLLGKAPWTVGGSWIERLQQRSHVVWPPVPEDAWAPPALHNLVPDGYADQESGRRRIVRVAWPHRWEHDKGCEELKSLIERCKGDPEIEFRWTILGRRFKEAPKAMKLIKEEHADVLDRFGGPRNRAEYLQILQCCDWVTSTARHEFFGIAVVEAIACGCLPWLPDRLSYPELIPSEYVGLTPWVSGIDTRKVSCRLKEYLSSAREHDAVKRIDASIEAAIGETRTRAL